MQGVPTRLLWWSLGEGVWSKSEQGMSVHVLCLSQTLESGSVDWGDGEMCRGESDRQVPASESSRIGPGDTCKEQPYLADSGHLEIRAKIKCYGSKMPFLPKPSLKDSFWRR